MLRKEITWARFGKTEMGSETWLFHDSHKRGYVKRRNLCTEFSCLISAFSTDILLRLQNCDGQDMPFLMIYNTVILKACIRVNGLQKFVT
jgi:hypothetical protein